MNKYALLLFTMSLSWLTIVHAGATPMPETDKPYEFIPDEPVLKRFEQPWLGSSEDDTITEHPHETESSKIADAWRGGSEIYDWF